MQNQALRAALFNMNPLLELQIRRTHIVEDTVMAINRHSLWELRRPLKVQSVSQGAVEPGEGESKGDNSNSQAAGTIVTVLPREDCFSLLLVCCCFALVDSLLPRPRRPDCRVFRAGDAAALPPQHALWEAREDWCACWFSGLPTDPRKSSLYQIFVLLGMRVDSGSSVGLSFPL